MITSHFATGIARRIYEGNSIWQWFEVGLGNVDITKLTDVSEVDDLGELPEENGYERLSVGAVDWSVVLDVNNIPTAILTLPSPPFENTGDEDWPAANVVFLVGTIDSSEHLLAVTSLSAEIELPAGEEMGLPDLQFPWKGNDYVG